MPTRVSSWGPRYVGYRQADRETPWARFFTDAVRPEQPQVRAAYDAPPTPPSAVPPWDGLIDELNGNGDEVENGYGRLPDGTVWVACETDMPGVTAAMWDWWFGWHLTESSRYKLWHPEAHAFAGVTLRPPDAPPGSRDAYLGRTSYVDEYVGPWVLQLAINFRDPVAAGFTVGDGTTVVYGRVGIAPLPIDVGYLAHQVRPVPGGSRMRSRFYLNKPGPRRPDLRQSACAVARGPFRSLRAPVPPNMAFARELLLHCGQEMNHLAAILPELHDEFADTR